MSDGSVDLSRGIAAIKSQLRLLSGGPGVYRMLDAGGDALYVGKARNLKRRVVTYTQPGRLPPRLQRMVAETHVLEVVTTQTEVEALLLESNLIKKLKPRYNVLFRDDKSFPYIHLTTHQDWPLAVKYRGSRNKPGDFFGPFASAGAVNRTLSALERAFLLRTCSDAVFKARTRPCLKYQLKRCSAPCVGRISQEDYGALVDEAKSFLVGRSHTVKDRLAKAMQSASDDLAFEVAARFRDRIRAMAQIQAHQDINVEGTNLVDADIIAAHAEAGQIGVQVFFFRAGRNNGNRAYYPRHDKGVDTAEVLTAFIGQFYENKLPPREVLLSHPVRQQELLAEALSVRAERRVRLSVPKRGPRRGIVDHALRNAREALGRRLAESASQRRLLEGVAEVFGLDAAPERIEVYDNSHISGTNPIGAMIVAGPEGFTRGAYRRFNIRTDVSGDDYAMMREVLTRRFSRAQKEDPDRSGGQWPDLVLLDGGKGQLSAALGIMAELGIEDVPMASIAKGPDRDAGRERFFLPDRAPFRLDEQDPRLYFLQRLRDEAHRFAIGGHRARRSRAIGENPLDGVPGVGPRRKRALLNHFGSAKAVSRAGLGDLESVEGVSKAVAKRVYDHFREDT